MALVPSSRYPAQTDAAAGYPQGKARNAGSFGDGTGTPLEKDWVNDVWGLLQSLLAEAGITPSGAPDEVGASDYLDAIKSVALAEAEDAVAADTSGVVTIDEDFLSGDDPVLISGALYRTATPFLFRQTGLTSFGLASPVTGMAGIFQKLTSSGAATGQLFTQGGIPLRATLCKCIWRTGIIASGNQFEFGVLNETTDGGGNVVVGATTVDGVSVVFNPATSPNFLLRTSTGGAGSNVNTGVPVVADTIYRMSLRWNGTHYALSINGSPEVQSAANEPGAAAVGFLQTRSVLAAAGANRRHTVDKIFLRAPIAGRVP